MPKTKAKKNVSALADIEAIEAAVAAAEGGQNAVTRLFRTDLDWRDNPAMPRAYEKALGSAPWTIGPSKHICKSEYTGTFTGPDLIQDGIVKLLEDSEEDEVIPEDSKIEHSKLENLLKKSARAKRNVETRKKNRHMHLTEKYWAELAPYLDHSTDPYSTLYGREGLSLTFQAMARLWNKKPNWAVAFFLRRILEIEREIVGRLMGVKRLATITQWVKKAVQFLKAELPPREDLI